MSVTGKGVTMGAPSTIVNPLTINKNGQFTAPEGQAYGPVTVDVEMFSFVVKGSGSFTTSGDININFGDTSSDYSGNNQTVNFSYNDEKAHRVVATGNLTNISFQNCTGLLSVDIPFPRSMRYTSSLSSCFKNCASLTSIPIGLFDNCPAVTSFSSCFFGCRALMGLAPGLWDTTKWPNVTLHSMCFYNCTGLSNYADIPSDWK